MPALRPYQIEILRANVTDFVTISAPQLGKTTVARLWLLARAFKHGPDSRPWWWTAPTYAQARHGFAGLVRHARETDLLESYTSTPPLELRLNFGATIEARSWDRPEGMYGPSVLGGVSDEFGWLTDAAYSAISSRRAETITHGFGHWLWIGNVGRMGGAAEKLWGMAESGAAGFMSRRWTWRDRALAHPCSCGNGEPVPCDLEHAEAHVPRCARGVYLRFVTRERSRMARAQFAQLYEAEWADWNELPVYAFDRALHVDDSVSLDHHLPIELACDFNVDPMCWIVGQHKGERVWAVDEIVIPGGATTQAACDEFKRRYSPDGRTHVVVYGDASGKSRSTKSHVSDYDIIRQSLVGYCDVRFDVPASNPAVAARINAVNGKLMSAAGEATWTAHPRCKTLIEDRARVSYKPGTRDIDKSDKRRTHASDADDYRIERLYPIATPTTLVVGTARSAPVHDPILEAAW